MLEIFFGSHIWAFVYTFETATYLSQYLSLWFKLSLSLKSTGTQGIDSTKYSQFFEAGIQYFSLAQGLSLFVKLAPGVLKWREKVIIPNHFSL